MRTSRCSGGPCLSAVLATFSLRGSEIGARSFSPRGNEIGARSFSPRGNEIGARSFSRRGKEIGARSCSPRQAMRELIIGTSVVLDPPGRRARGLPAAPARQEGVRAAALDRRGPASTSSESSRSEEGIDRDAGRYGSVCSEATRHSARGSSAARSRSLSPSSRRGPGNSPSPRYCFRSSSSTASSGGGGTSGSRPSTASRSARRKGCASPPTAMMAPRRPARG